MITLTAGIQSFTGASLDDLAEQLMSAQKDGSYPMWRNDNDDFDVTDCEQEEAEYGLVPGWQRFDGTISRARRMPTRTEEDLLDYARWSLKVDEASITYEADQ